MLDKQAALLNATADVDALRHLLGTDTYPVTVYSPHVGLHQATTLRYVLGANHSKQALRGKGGRGGGVIEPSSLSEK